MTLPFLKQMLKRAQSAACKVRHSRQPGNNSRRRSTGLTFFFTWLVDPLTTSRNLLLKTTDGYIRSAPPYRRGLGRRASSHSAGRSNHLNDPLGLGYANNHYALCRRRHKAYWTKPLARYLVALQPFTMSRLRI